ncbi:coiled-coil domain-containing protein 120 [Dryobates pubescens]|uniref:coiled-coil domain-containing protein 120 n=1 Tax=Dryobates pubescens TaxID=118200 RepID=UPI0023B935D3|nr:coiled-coil domain-containing protein 120 [Dryobates pubescens]
MGSGGVRGDPRAPGGVCEALTGSTYSPAALPAGGLQELQERQRSLRQALGLRLRELRRLCLQEAELTGKLPPEYPLEPGERPQPPPAPPRCGNPPGTPPRAARPARLRPVCPFPAPVPRCLSLYPSDGLRTAAVGYGAFRAPAARAARREVAVQLQVVEAARRLATAPGLPPEQRRRRQRLQAEAAQRLRQLRAQLDENGSLCDLPTLENGVLPHPKPPRAGPGSPDRRPPPWTPETPGGGPGRRSSLASPASPARTLPRSASSFEGRSVPATPVLPRSPRGPPCR